MKRWAYVLPLLVVAAMVVVLFVGLSLDPREVDSPLIGKPAPAFALPALGQDRLLSEADLAQGVTLLNVWASWCPSCRIEHPVLMELARQPGIRIFGLNYKDDPADAQQWLQRHGDPYVASAMDRDGAVGLDWGVYGAPETFVLDDAGVVRAKRIGPVTWDWINSELMPLIAQGGGQ